MENSEIDDRNFNIKPLAIREIADTASIFYRNLTEYYKIIVLANILSSRSLRS
uniref:DNA topoisomerase (ATP-hydrolyzing) n=1 Tax=Heterorhabditis bacteriophora TaxID=37862 RepID=A0A1I7X218_HETBA